MNKKKLYESIMRSVSREVKNVLNENNSFDNDVIDLIKNYNPVTDANDAPRILLQIQKNIFNNSDKLTLSLSNFETMLVCDLIPKLRNKKNILKIINILKSSNNGVAYDNAFDKLLNEIYDWEDTYVMDDELSNTINNNPSYESNYIDTILNNF